jgi:hypothetical protein
MLVVNTIAISLLFSAPDAPLVEVYCNQSDAVFVKWSSQDAFTKPVDRYIILCETVTNVSNVDSVKEIKLDNINPDVEEHEVIL